MKKIDELHENKLPTFDKVVEELTNWVKSAREQGYLNQEIDTDELSNFSLWI